MDEFLEIARALADESRVRILLALKAGGELCVCQLIELLSLAPSTVSKHVTVLKQAGLVELRKDGRWIFYRLADEKASPQVRRALQWVVESVGRCKQAQEDRKRVKEILKMDKEELCKVLRKN